MTEENEIIHKTRIYNRMYYHRKMKGEFECQNCNKIYSSISALVRHQRRSIRCKLIKTTKELENLKTDDTLNNH